MTTIKLTDYLNEGKAKYIEMNLVLQHGQKRPKPVQPYYYLTPTFGEVKPNKEGKIISQNVFTDEFYQVHQKQVRPHMNITEYNAIGVDTRQIQQLDFDTKTPEAERITDEMKHDGAPFFLSYSKRLPHFVFPSQHNLEQNTYDMFSKVTNEHLGELLCGQWSYAKPDEDVQNCEGENTYWDFDIHDNPWIYIKTKEEKEPATQNLKMKEFTFKDKTLKPQISSQQPEDEKPEVIPQHTKELLEELGFECLDHEKYIKQQGNYNLWCKLIWSLHEHKELAKKLSKLGGNRYDESVFESTFNSFDSNKYKEAHKNISLGTFFYICKDSNPEKYKQIMLNHNGKMPAVDNFGDIQTHTDKAELTFKHYGNDFIYIQTDKNMALYVWDNTTENWFKDSNDKDRTRHFILEKLNKWGEIALDGIEKYEDVHNESGKKVGKQITDEYKQMRKLIHSNKQLPELKNVTDYFKTLLCHRNDDIVFDLGKEQIYNLHFKNGVLDVRTGDFRRRQKTDYVVTWLKWEYNKNVEPQLIKEVENFFIKVQPDETQRTFALTFYAYSLTGDCGMQIFKMNYGNTASNGKSTELDIHEITFPIYTEKINRMSFCKDYQKKHKEFIGLIREPIRLVYIEELERKKLDAEELKDFVDARKFPVEVLFGTKEAMALQCKLVFTSNKTLSVESDEGILRRGVQQNYTSRFLDADHSDQGQPNVFVKEKNYSLKFEHDDYKNAYLQLLLRHYKKTFEVPDENKNLFKESAESSDEFLNVFEANLKKTGSDGDKVYQENMKLIFQTGGVNWKEASGRLKDSMGLRYEKTWRDADGRKGVWVGVRELEEDE